VTPRRIPVVDARGADHPAAFAAEALPAEVDRILAQARRSYTAAGLAVGDAISRRWLARSISPLTSEIDAVAARLRRPGAHLLNLSFEWGCTCGVLAHGAPVMLRVLDWKLEGLGETLSVIRQRGPAGEWFHLGWPGLAGGITALAPGRFAVAINQPPLPETRLGAAARARGLALPALLADWTASRPAAWRSRALPPAHLLRLACDTAPDFAAALDMLREVPLAAPAAFTLAGTRPGEAAVVERGRDQAAVRAGPEVAVANHWQALGLRGAPRWQESGPRQARMEALLSEGPVPDGFAWLTPPLRNAGTRLAAVLRPADGAFDLVAHEGETPVSEVLSVAA